MRVLQNKLIIGKPEITKLDNEDGQVTYNREKILRPLGNFYIQVYIVTS